MNNLNAILHCCVSTFLNALQHIAANFQPTQVDNPTTVQRVPKIYFSDAIMKALENEVELGKIETLIRHLRSFADEKSAQPVLQYYPELAVRFLPLISSQREQETIAPLVTKTMLQFMRFQVCQNALQKKSLPEDVQLQINGKTVATINKPFLMCLNDAFCAMFSHKLQESSTNIIDFQNAYSEETIRSFKEYLYTGLTPQAKNWSVVVELFHLSRSYDIVLLRNYCKEQLKTHVEAMDCLTAEKMAISLRKILQVGANDSASQTFLNELCLTVIRNGLKQQTELSFSAVELELFMNAMESLRGGVSTTRAFLDLRKEILVLYCKNQKIRYETAHSEGFLLLHSAEAGIFLEKNVVSIILQKYVSGFFLDTTNDLPAFKLLADMPLKERTPIRQVMFSSNSLNEVPIAFELFPQLEMVSIPYKALSCNPLELVEFITLLVAKQKSTLVLIEIDFQSTCLSLLGATVPFITAIQESPPLLFKNLESQQKDGVGFLINCDYDEQRKLPDFENCRGMQLYTITKLTYNEHYPKGIVISAKN